MCPLAGYLLMDSMDGVTRVMMGQGNCVERHDALKVLVGNMPPARRTLRPHRQAEPVVSELCYTLNPAEAGVAPRLPRKAHQTGA